MSYFFYTTISTHAAIGLRKKSRFVARAEDAQSGAGLPPARPADGNPALCGYSAKIIFLVALNFGVTNR